MSTGISVVHRTAESVQAELATTKLEQLYQIVTEEVNSTKNPLFGRLNTAELKLKLTIRLLREVINAG